MTNYKKMYELTSKAISDALAILSSDPQREDAKEWVQFLLEQAQIRANYVYRVSILVRAYITFAKITIS